MSYPDQPGVYPSLPIEDYHAGPGYSSTHIKCILSESPFAFRHRFILEPEEPKPSKWGDRKHGMILGGLVAALADSEDTFRRGYAVIEEKAAAASKNSNDFKHAWRAAVEANPDKTVVLPVEADKAIAICEAMYAHPDQATREQLNAFLDHQDLRAECSHYLKDEETGLLVKTRLDLGVPKRMAADIKTTADCSQPAYSRRLKDNQAHVQAAMGLDIQNRVDDGWIKEVLHIVVEQSPPHDVAVYRLGQQSLDIGYRQYRHGLKLLAQCLETDAWPGKVSGVQTVDLPEWYMRNEL